MKRIIIAAIVAASTFGTAIAAQSIEAQRTHAASKRVEECLDYFANISDDQITQADTVAALVVRTCVLAIYVHTQEEWRFYQSVPKLRRLHKTENDLWDWNQGRWKDTAMRFVLEKRRHGK